MYRNCVYDPKNCCVHLFTWDGDGNRVKLEVPFQPYLFVEDRAGTHTSIHGTKLKRKVFRSSFERNKFVKDSGIRRLFENIPPAQQYLIDEFWQLHELPEFLNRPIKMLFIDIETYSPNAFPNVDDPQDPINVITCYDSLNSSFITFGTKPYTGTSRKMKYVYCRTEKEMFLKFLEYLEKDYPDIMSGWNSEFFDVPYIINRGEKIVGDDIKRLSPLGVIRRRTFMGPIGKEQTKYHLDGVAMIDYLDIYKKFTMARRESYKLDAIGELELGQNKLDYGDMSLAKLSEDDWNKFVDYNVHDVQLLVNLEAKLKYLQLLRMLSSAGCATLEGAMGTLSVVTGAMVCQARGNNEVIATFVRPHHGGQNPGAYVAEPLQGFNEYAVSFDANSLYPSIMITLNASPETKIGTVSKSGDLIVVKHISGKTYELEPRKFAEWMKKENMTLSKAGILFTQKKKGILPDFVDRYYQQRVAVRAKLKEKQILLKEIENDKSRKQEVADLKVEISNLNIQQHTIKILINSAYGYCGNKQAALGDDDIASSITLTGQAVIKQSNEIVREFIKERIPDVTPEEIEKCIVYNDTDSLYISIKSFVTRGLNFANNDIVSDEAYKLTDEIEQRLNTDIMKWGASALNSKDVRLVFKRECICDVGIFLQKKRYVLHILDNEGIKCNKFKYVGVEVVRTTMPNTIKPYAKKIIETMMKTRSLDETTKVLNETFDVFSELSEEEMAFVKGVNKYEHYAGTCEGFTMGKKIPGHVKAAYYYNILLEKFGVANKYEALGSGDKVRYLYLDKNNKYGIGSVGFKYTYPKEFSGALKIDVPMMFEKMMFKVIERFYTAAGWSVRKPWETVNTEIGDLFG